MRRTLTALAAGMLALLLGGCVGIPTSGGVNDGAVIDAQGSTEFIALPSDPVPGSSQEQILAGFMQAVGGPQNQYAVARKFLTSALADDWNPDASAIIRTSSPVVQAVDEQTMTYSISSRASVNELGQYREERSAAPQTLTFQFAQENGEWRISQAADGIVLSQSAFNIAFRAQALYFFDPSYGYLVPDLRWFPARPTSSVRVVQALLAGPSSWLQQAVTTAFPDATTLGEITPESGGMIVDLSTEALSSTPQERDRMRQQLAETLDAPNVSLTVQGLELVTPNATGNRAVVNPSVEAAALVGAAGNFGFDGGGGIAPIDGLTEQVVASGAVGAALSADKQSAALLGPDGSVSVAVVGGSSPTPLAAGPGLVTPSIDPFQYVWTAASANAATLTTYDVDGGEHELQSGLSADSGIMSLDVSRDGTRLLVLLTTPVGPRLIVAGIIRQNGVPIRLGEAIDLPVGPETQLDSTWVDDRTVAAVSNDGQASAIVTVFEIGGPSAALGRVQGAYAIAGGRSGTDGLRVLTVEGEVWRPRGSEGWVTTAITALFLGTKQ